MGVSSISAQPLESLRIEPRQRRQAREDPKSFLMAVPPRHLQPLAADDSTKSQPPAIPRLTVHEMKLYSAGDFSQWATQIPHQAIFYDEVDSITQGRKELGAIVDRRA
jgi:hypothetical protein